MIVPHILSRNWLWLWHCVSLEYAYHIRLSDYYYYYCIKVKFNTTMIATLVPYLIIFSYSLSLPLESRQRRYMTLASTFAGLKVLGSLSREITDSRTVRTDCVGFQRSQGSSPDWGSSTGGCKIDMHKSPFWKINTTI